MPLFFIHGVNVRTGDKGYEKDRSRRGKLFRDLVLRPLASHGSRYAGINVHDVYWGDLGVSFSWKLASVPKIRTLDAFGPDDAAGSTDLLVEQALETITRPDSVGEITAFSESSEGTLKRASANDPVRFAETLLLPVLLSDYDLSDESSEEEGELQALLAQATRDAASDQSVQVEMKAAATDAHLIAVLSDAIERRFRTLAEVAVSSENDPNESYGPQFLDGARLRVRELFGRALHLPGRAVSVQALRFVRPGFHRKFSRFLGDIFVYLKHRGTPSDPGPIPQLVMSKLKAAPREHPEEPTIVVTHSMGGNILYDILTSFDPKLFVDVWVSVGGQVAQFEEMKLFLASDGRIAAPAQVEGIKNRVGYWLNVYDPADSFSFMANPVFAGVDADLAFSTGTGAMTSHGEYFGLASFHSLMGEHIMKGLKLA